MIVQTLRGFTRVFRVRPEGGNAEFWVSQLIVLMATVLGVYLAATEGFKLAIHFESLTSKKDSYYLQSSLYDELADNVVTAEALVERIDKKQGAPKHFIDEYRFSFFVWDSIKGNNITFQIPSDILNDIRSYYFVNEDLREGMTSSWAYDSNQAKIQFAENTQKIKTETLPALQANINELERVLVEHRFIDRPIKQ